MARTNREVALASGVLNITMGSGEVVEPPEQVIQDITNLVHAIRMTEEGDMGTTFTMIAQWFNENWEVTLYEGNQYAADLIKATL